MQRRDDKCNAPSLPETYTRCSTWSERHSAALPFPLLVLPAGSKAQGTEEKHAHAHAQSQPQRALPAHIREPVYGREVARQAQAFLSLPLCDCWCACPV